MRLKSRKDKISVIVVNWNQKGETIDCLKSVFSSTYKNIEVILVDNGSTDKTVEYVKKRFPKVKLIENSENLGFAPACNQGYNISTGDYIYLLNNDAVVTKDCIHKMYIYLKTKRDMGAIQSKIYIKDFPEKNDVVGTFLTHTGFTYYFGYWKSDENKYIREREIFFFYFSSLMVKRNVIEKIGLFDDNYFTYYEEFDFCWRIWLSGWKIGYLPSAVVFHRVGMTTRNMPSDFSLYYTFRNRITTLLKNLSFLNLIWMMPVHLIFSFFYQFYYWLVSRKRQSPILRAVFWNILNINRTLRKRSYVQNTLRVVSDRKIFRNNLITMPLIYYKYLLTKAWLFEDLEI